jgi:hypothetical protein
VRDASVFRSMVEGGEAVCLLGGCIVEGKTERQSRGEVLVRFWRVRSLFAYVWEVGYRFKGVQVVGEARWRLSWYFMIAAYLGLRYGWRLYLIGWTVVVRWMSTASPYWITASATYYVLYLLFLNVTRIASLKRRFSRLTSSDQGSLATEQSAR